MRKVPPLEDLKFWAEVEHQAKVLNSDGCTAVTDFRIECCWRHDIAYSTGKDVDGLPISKKEADALFRECIQSRSPLRHIGLQKLSPMSWIRWAGVSLFGRGIWKNQK